MLKIIVLVGYTYFIFFLPVLLKKLVELLKLPTFLLKFLTNLYSDVLIL